MINLLLFSIACIHAHPSSPKLSAYWINLCVSQHWQASDWQTILEKCCLICNNMLFNIQKEAKGSSWHVEKKISTKMRSLKDDFFSCCKLYLGKIRLCVTAGAPKRTVISDLLRLVICHETVWKESLLHFHYQHLEKWIATLGENSLQRVSPTKNQPF